MVKKGIKSSAAKPLREKLIAAVHKVLIENKSELTDKMIRVINKAINKIAKKTDKQIEKTLKAKKVKMVTR